MAYQNLDPQEFEAAYQEDQQATVLDVRTPEEVADGHIDGATALDFLAEDFEAQAEKLDRNRSYYVYCRSGKRSAQACLVLERLGFEQVYNLDGGYLAWQAR